MPSSIIVTGALGKLGRSVCAQLVADGYDVIGLDQAADPETSAPAAPPITATSAATGALSLRRINLCDVPSGQLAAVCEGADALIHLANHPSAWHPDRSEVDIFSDNMRMNMVTFDAAATAGVPKIIFASSVQVIAGWRAAEAPDAHGGLAYLPADGDMPAHPGNVYALSKHFGEQMLEQMSHRVGLSCVALRLPWLINAEDLHWLRQGRPRRPREWQKINEAFALLRYEDAASLMSAILTSDLPGFRTYFPAAGDGSLGLSIEQIVERWYPEAALRQPLAEMDRLVDISRIERETGWRPALDRLDAAAPDLTPTQTC